VDAHGQAFLFLPFFPPWPPWASSLRISLSSSRVAGTVERAWSTSRSAAPRNARSGAGVPAASDSTDTTGSPRAARCAAAETDRATRGVALGEDGRVAGRHVAQIVSRAHEAHPATARAAVRLDDERSVVQKRRELLRVRREVRGGRRHPRALEHAGRDDLVPEHDGGGI